MMRKLIKLLENIYLKSDNSFLGRQSNKIEYIHTICSASETMPSQVIGNCTVYNLRHALKHLFEWSEAELVHFEHDTILCYNSLLKKHNEYIPDAYKVANHTLSTKSQTKHKDHQNNSTSTSTAHAECSRSDVEEIKDRFVRMVVQSRENQRARSNSFP